MSALTPAISMEWTELGKSSLWRTRRPGRAFAQQMSERVSHPREEAHICYVTDDIHIHFYFASHTQTWDPCLNKRLLPTEAPCHHFPDLPNKSQASQCPHTGPGTQEDPGPAPLLPHPCSTWLAVEVQQCWLNPCSPGVSRRSLWAEISWEAGLCVLADHSNGFAEPSFQHRCHHQVPQAPCEPRGTEPFAALPQSLSTLHRSLVYPKDHKILCVNKVWHNELKVKSPLLFSINPFIQTNIS